MSTVAPASEPHDPENLLDRLTPDATLGQSERAAGTVQRAVGTLDALGSWPRLAAFGHTLMLLAGTP